MKTGNPFAVSMVKMQMPANMAGSTMNVGGFELEPDSDGVVEVPSKHKAELMGHGLTEYVEKTPAQVGRVSGSGGDKPK